MAGRKPSFGPALAVSLLLHAGIIAALIWVYPRETANLVLSAVPVEIVSDVQREATPQPPAPEVPPAPQPQPPQPQPPQPQADQKPNPAPTARALPPRAQPKADDFLRNLTTSLSSSSAQAQRQPQQPQFHRPGEGRDQVSTGPDIDALQGKIGDQWHPQCGAPGADQVEVVITLQLHADGTVARDPTVESYLPANRTGDSAAAIAKIATRAARYGDLPPEQLRILAGRGLIRIKLSQKKFCS